MNFPPSQTIQKLLRECERLDVKPPERHDMKSIVCDTASCAVGDMYLAGDVSGKNSPCFSPFCGFQNVWPKELGLTKKEFSFLFSSHFGPMLKKHKWSFARQYRINETPAKTAARIRKYVYYKLHKKELLGDCETKEGRERYEQARHTEGDHGFAQIALAEEACM